MDEQQRIQVVAPNPELPASFVIDHQRNPQGQPKVVLRLFLVTGQVVVAVDPPLADKLGKDFQEHARQASQSLDIAAPGTLEALKQTLGNGLRPNGAPS